MCTPSSRPLPMPAASNPAPTAATYASVSADRRHFSHSPDVRQVKGSSTSDRHTIPEGSGVQGSSLKCTPRASRDQSVSGPGVDDGR